MNSPHTILKIKQELFRRWENEATGHDFFHLERVVKMARKIYEKEGGDWFLIEISAWLHDAFDDKIVENMEQEKEDWCRFLKNEKIEEETIEKVFKIIDEVSFRKNKNSTPSSIEAKIVQDADRLDALGAIGIARTFAYGGKKGRPIYDGFPTPDEGMNPESESTLAHFYEKLLRLKGLLNTETAKVLSEERHIFMENFLTQFYKEWSAE